MGVHQREEAKEKKKTPRIRTSPTTHKDQRRDVTKPGQNGLQSTRSPKRRRRRRRKKTN